jgi:hypothetical protein
VGVVTVAVIVGLAVTLIGLLAARLFRPPMDWPDIPDDYDQAMDERIGDALQPEAERIVP